MNRFSKLFCCLLALPFLFPSLPVHAYDQVNIEKIIPLAHRKSIPGPIRLDKNKNLWVLVGKRKTIQLIDWEGRPKIILKSGKRESSLFKDPVDFAFTNEGVLAVADPGLDRIAFIEPSKGSWKKPKLVKTFPVNNPMALAVSRDGIVAVADSKGSIIRVYSIDGVHLHNLLAPKSHSFKGLSALAYAKDGVLWALDRDRATIHRFSSRRKWLGAIENVRDATAMAIDDFGFVYVSSKKGRWTEIDPQGKKTGTFGTKGKNPGQMSKPMGIAVVDSSRVWISEAGNKRLQQFLVTNKNKENHLIRNPAARIQVRRLGAITGDYNDILFGQSNLILGLNAKRKKFTWFTLDGKTVDSFSSKKRDKRGLLKPVSFISNKEGELLVTDQGSHNIKKISIKGEVLGTLSQKGRREGSLKGPARIKVRKDGSVVVSDRGDSRVQVLSSDGLFLFKLGKRGKGKGEYATVTDLAVTDEEIVILDNDRKALIFYDNNGKFVREIVNQEDKAPVWGDIVSLATDEQNRFYILDNEMKRVRIFEKDGTFIADFSATGERIASGKDGKLALINDDRVDLFSLHVVPVEVSNLSVKDNEGILEVTWDSPGDVSDFRVYRSTSHLNFRMYGTSNSDGLQDLEVISGIKYQYGVVGVTKFGYEGFWAQTEPIKASRRKDLPLVSVVGSNFNPVFTAAFKYYVSHPIGTVTIQNNSDKPVRNVTLSAQLKRYTDYATQKTIKLIQPAQHLKVPINLTFNNKVLELTENTPVQMKIKLTYYEDRQKKSTSKNAPLELLSRNAIVWKDKSRISSFITPRDKPVVEFSRAGIRSFLSTLKGSTVGKPLAKVILFYEALNALDISYVPDPNTPFVEAAENPEILDYVQFPRETLRRKTGDCDDTTALLASLLESIGVEVALLESPGHIFLMANLEESDPDVIGLPEERFVEYRGTLWVPVETTKLGKGFEEAWQSGITTVRSAKESNELNIISLIEATEKYAPVTLVEAAEDQPTFPKSKLEKTFLPLLDELQQERYKFRLKHIKSLMREDPSNMMLKIRLGMVHVEGGREKEGQRIFETLLKDESIEVQAAAYNNLGNLAYLKGNYKTALKNYEDAAILSPDDGGIIINKARSNWKLGRRSSAKKNLYEAREIMQDWREYVTDIPAELLPK